MLIHFYFHLDGSAVYIIDKKDSAPSSKARKTRRWLNVTGGRKGRGAKKLPRSLFRSRCFVTCACTRETSFSNLVPRVGHFLGSHVKVRLSFVLLESAMSKACQILHRKNNGFPFLDILGYLKNTHKNPKFGRVRQVPTREFPTKFSDWDLSHSSKFGIFVGIF